MRVVVPIAKENPCGCNVETFLVYFDAYGLTGIECPIHGPPMRIDKLEFDSEEAYERWKNENIS